MEFGDKESDGEDSKNKISDTDEKTKPAKT